MNVVEVADAEAMQAWGSRLAAVLQAGDLVLLSGPLGAGKTTLAQGIGAGLGVTGPVVSPTFVIARIYRGGRLPMVHVDAYRLGGVDEVDDLDLDASVGESVTVVEWGEGLVESLAENRLEVRIERPEGIGDEDGDDTRTVRVLGHGPRWTGVGLAL
ncbi:MAG: tRNA threonylcarbamoyladenosine biosynthesis protein TsaE [Frankiales bacterium]|nr:tRNA threonylcarbamoyladenosine biosynthesis protein TsaE [Frankiales bacterium]